MYGNDLLLEVHWEIKEILGIRVLFNLRVFLSMTSGVGNKKRNNSIMVTSLLTAALILIAGLWKTPHALSFENWKGRPSYIYIFDGKLSAMVEYRMDNLNAM